MVRAYGDVHAGDSIMIKPLNLKFDVLFADGNYLQIVCLEGEKRIEVGRNKYIGHRTSLHNYGNRTEKSDKKHRLGGHFNHIRINLKRIDGEGYDCILQRKGDEDRHLPVM